MNGDQDMLGIKKNFMTLVLAALVILVLIDITLRAAPGLLRADLRPQISAVGHQIKMPDGSMYYIYTVFESTGDVYQCWWDEKLWNQKKVTNYRGATLPESGK